MYKIKKILIISIFICIIIMTYELIRRSRDIKYKVTTSLQDKFYVYADYKGSIPEVMYEVKIYECKYIRKKLICTIGLIEDIDSEKLSLLYLDNDIKCYYYSTYIIYKKDSNNYYEFYDLSSLRYNHTEQNEFLIPIAMELFKTNWDDAAVVIEFLATSHNTQAKNLLIRYAKGDFTKEEVENNSIIAQEEMQELCRNHVVLYE